MKVRMVLHLVPLQRGKALENMPPGLPAVIKAFIEAHAMQPGEPIIMSKVIDFPDNSPFKLHAGLQVQVTKNRVLQVSMVKWDRFDKNIPVKVVFGGGIEVGDLDEVLQEIKEDGGWREGCDCRACQERNDFSEMMRDLLKPKDSERN